MIQVGLSDTIYVDENNLLYPNNTMTVYIPDESTITGAHINIHNDISVNTGGYNNNLNFILEDTNVEISIKYERPTSLINSNVIPITLGYHSMTNNNSYSIDENEIVLDYFSFNGNTYMLYVILSENDAIKMKLTKSGL